MNRSHVDLAALHFYCLYWEFLRFMVMEIFVWFGIINFLIMSFYREKKCLSLIEEINFVREVTDVCGLSGR